MPKMQNIHNERQVPKLQYAHNKAPGKHLIQSEACVDAEVPKWQDDAWYWSKEATDWGWDWAPDDQKHLHPKYVPVYRYARDIIGCLNNWVDGWIDWNMVLDETGGDEKLGKTAGKDREEGKMTWPAVVLPADMDVPISRITGMSKACSAGSFTKSPMARDFPSRSTCPR